MEMAQERAELEEDVATEAVESAEMVVTGKASASVATAETMAGAATDLK